MVKHYFELVKGMLRDPGQRLQYSRYMERAGTRRLFNFKHYVALTILCYSAFFYWTARDSPTMKYRIALTRRISRLTGYVMSMPLPPGIRVALYKAFGTAYGVNFDEILVDNLNQFTTFN